MRLVSVPRTLGLLLLVSACATSRPEPQSESLTFLVDGTTTREEVVLRPGIPAASFEGARILVYSLARNRKKGFAPTPGDGSGAGTSGDSADEYYSLVLVFDAQQMLRRHNLILLTR
jgi:hypothetical protein